MSHQKLPKSLTFRIYLFGLDNDFRSSVVIITVFSLEFFLGWYIFYRNYWICVKFGSLFSDLAKLNVCL